MQTLISKKSLAELRLIQLLLERFLASIDTSQRSHARQSALSGCLHAIQTIHLWLSQSAQKGHDNLLDKQIQLANTVVSQGGINDAARKFLRSSDFNSLLTRTDLAFIQCPSNPVLPGPQCSPSESLSFDPLRFFPCVVGSGRLAAAFLAGFQSLGVPNHHITIFSRSSLTSRAPLNTWLRTFLDQEPDVESYRQFTFQQTPPTVQPGPLFLMIKRKGFDDPRLRDWLRIFRQQNHVPAVINLMAGGALNPYDDTELVMRSNVLVARPGGGNLLVQKSQMESTAWKHVEHILRAMGNVIPVDSASTQAKLTFFTSTLPLVFLTEINRACYQSVPNKEVNRLVLNSCMGRFQLLQKVLNGHLIACKSLDSALEASALKYMDIYLGAI